MISRNEILTKADFAAANGVSLAVGSQSGMEEQPTHGSAEHVDNSNDHQLTAEREHATAAIDRARIKDFQERQMQEKGAGELTRQDGADTEQNIDVVEQPLSRGESSARGWSRQSSSSSRGESREALKSARSNYSAALALGADWAIRTPVKQSRFYMQHWC